MVAEGTEHLAWETRQRTGAATAAAVAAVCLFVGTVWRGLILADLPRTGVLQALDLAGQPGPVGSAESLRIDTLRFYDEQSTGVLLASLVVALGYVGLGWALSFLAQATRARRPGFPRLLTGLPIIAGVLQAISTVASTLATNGAIGDFLGGRRTVDDALDITGSGLGVFAQVLALPAVLGLALSLVFISLNAMRVGLLTRFMGVLGMITAALQILPIGGPLPVVQCFWLIMLAVLFLGRWPGRTPPAWRTGRAEPWPSSAEVRAARQQAAASRRGEPVAETEPVAVAAGSAAAASAAGARRKKRKRRA